MKLSKQDKNLVSLLMIAEILTKSITEEAERLGKTAPDAKAGQYDEILDRIRPLHGVLTGLNDTMSDDVHSVLSEDEQTLLVDSVLSICLLLETQSPKQVNSVMKAAGIRSKDIVENYFKKTENNS
ncbi:hypothetical protein EOM86_13185 [Candidatus Nomurabacteria bacterium]|nr:hypothetical protein [Candidatus Nomurabacteria bacterium]